MVNNLDTIKKFEDYFRLKNIPETKIISEMKFEIDYKDLCQYDTEIVDELFEKPEEVIECGEKAIEQIYERKIKLRINNYGQYPSNIIKIREIRSEHINKMKVVKGMIKQASKVLPIVVSSKFECPACGNLMTILQRSATIKTPERCGCGRKGKFILIEEEKKDSQRIVLQEDIETLEGTQLPSEIGIMLQDDLTNPNFDVLISQGNRVAITGIIKAIPKFKAMGESTEREWMIMANCYEPLEEQYKEIKISESEKREIIELSNNPDLKQLMIDSYCPEIYGENYVKLGILLQIFGARPLYKDGRKLKSGNFHILLIGDPSKGKSTLAKFASTLALKYQYASGKGATGRGLTAYIVKDEFLGTWGVQAGAVVLASGGVATIDEIDKMDKEEQGHLSECMSEQRVTLTKVIRTSLKAETAILGCANFKEGRFNPFADTFSQIDFPSWMINRFALIYVLKDEPETKRDENVFNTIIGRYSNSDVIKSAINLTLLKKYIIYARDNIFPELTTEAQIEIKNIYMGLRNKVTLMGTEKYKTIPINERQLENLLLISEAAARMRLSNNVTKEDVETAKDVLFTSLKQVAFDVDKQTFDMEVIETGVTTKSMNIVEAVRDVINKLEMNFGKSVSTDEVVRICKSLNINEFDVEKSIDKLKKAGDVYEPRNGFVQRL